MKRYEIWWDDLTEEAKERLSGLDDGNAAMTPLAIVEVEDEPDSSEEEHVCPECGSADVHPFFDPDTSMNGECRGECRDCGYEDALRNFKPE